MLNIAFTTPLVWLATDDRLFRAAYIDAQDPADGTAATSLVTRIVIAVTIAVAVGFGEGWLQALTRRGTEASLTSPHP